MYPPAEGPGSASGSAPLSEGTGSPGRVTAGPSYSSKDPPLDGGTRTEPLEGRAPTPPHARLGSHRPSFRRGLFLVVVGVIVLTMLVQPLVILPAASSSGPVSTPSGVTPVPSAPGPAATVPAGSLAGQRPSGVPVDFAPLLQAQRDSEAAPANVSNLPASAGLSQGRAASQAPVPIAPSAVPPSPPSVSTARVLPDGVGLDYGYVTGVVVNSFAPHDPISGATAEALPVTTFCPSVGCLANQTDADGGFRIAAAVGENQILIQDAYFMTNRTWTYVSAGAIVNVGTIELIPDGYVTGTVRGGDLSHEPVPGINITASTRDGSFIASPSAHTDSSGEFTVAVPPVPSLLTFTPIFAGSPYEQNVTFINVSAGQTISVGTIYLQRPTLVSVNIEDSISHSPIVPADDVAAAATICSKVTGYCAEEGSTGTGPTLTAYAPVGPDTIEVAATGFVTNITSLGWVPEVRVGAGPISMGTIDLVPEGAISFYSNVTGVPQPYGSSAPSSFWPVPQSPLGTIYVTVCSLDAVSAGFVTGLNVTSSGCEAACVNPGEPEAVLGFPLRDYMFLTPATSTECDPYEATWPIPPDMPVFPNWDWANVTPDEYTYAGNIGLLPGTYVEGQVLPASQVNWDVEACSTDESSICGVGVFSDAAYEDDFINQPPVGCPEFGEPDAGTTFCAPAPPGPDELKVTSPNASSNFTWATVPPLQWSAFPLPLESASSAHIQSINLTSARVSGRVLQARSLTPVAGLPSVQACPAGALPAGVACTSTAPNSTGYFSLWAPIGWDRVTVSAPDYLSNSTWVFVAHSNSSGTILLTPYGSVEGRIVDPGGDGIYAATVAICPATAPTACTPIGAAGIANTGGFYYGTSPAGDLPLGSYEVIASATGYTTDWTWLNITTPGQNFTVPTIVLDPVGGSAPTAGPDLAGAGSPTPAASGGTLAGAEWLSGTVVDAQQNIPLTTASISANPVNGGPPDVISSIRSTGGEFNDSVPDGTYYVAVTQSGFYSDTFFLNVSGNASTIALGTFALTPYPTVTGRLFIDPYGWRTGVSESMGFGPGAASVEVCTNLATICISGTVDSAGDFNLTAPVGTYDFLEANGNGNGVGSATGGFVFNRTFFNVTNATPVKPVQMGLDIFGTIVGTVVDAADHSVPVRYDGIVADEEYPVDLTEPEQINADGSYVVFIAATEQLNMTVGGLGSWVEINVTAPAHIAYTNGVPDLYLLPGGEVDFGTQFAIEHFGWINAEVRNAVTGLPVPYATVSAQESGTLWGAPVIYETFGIANEGGYVNLSAMPSIPSTERLSVNISAPDYLYEMRNVTVNSSKVTYVNGSSPFKMGPIGIEPWGWISGTVSDAVTGRPLQSVAVAASANAGLSLGASGVETNGLGAYRTDAPVSKSVALALTLIGYSANTSRYNVSAGTGILATPVHLTGDGLVEGRVIAAPGGAAVAGATVQVCPTNAATCSTSVTTNESGFFVIGAVASLDAIVVTDNGYVPNVPQILPVVSDTWTWAGVISLFQYATVTGTVVGLPNGFSLASANASLCGLTSNGQGAGPCFVTVQTGPTGEFSVQVAAGEYVLEVNTTFYNDTYLIIAVTAGESLSVGTIFVDEFGTISGTVESATSDAVVEGATISACENWGAGVCLPTTSTGPDGTFLVGGPSGPYTVEVNAAGYQAAFASTVVGIADDSALPTFLLTPIGPGSHYPVSGTVFAAGGGALGGAIVSASGGYTSYTSVSGGYSIALPWGTDSLTASYPGYVPVTRTFDVTGATVNVDFALVPMTFAVSGVVTDGLSDQPIAGVQLYENDLPVGSPSGPTGAFSVALPNGSHDLVAEPPTGTVWVSVPFSVEVVGAPVVRDLVLYPLSVSVAGTVVSSLSGTAIGGASVRVAGMTDENVAWSGTATSDPSGHFLLSSFPGTYRVVVTENGYVAANESLQLNDSSTMVPVTVALMPASAPTPASGPSDTAYLWAGLAVAIAAVAVAATVVLARRPPTLGRARDPGSPPRRD